MKSKAIPTGSRVRTPGDTARGFVVAQSPISTRKCQVRWDGSRPLQWLYKSSLIKLD